MKTTTCLLLALICCTTAYAGIEGITILSESHHVSGTATGTTQSDSYDLTQSTSVTGSASALWQVDDEFYPGPNPGTNEVSSSAGNFSVTATDNSCWAFTGSEALAESTYTFTPLVTDLQFNYTGNVEMQAEENAVSVTIEDITNGQTIDTRLWTTGLSSGLSINENLYYTFDLTHEYELKLYAKVEARGNPGVTSAIDVAITPEPATLALLAIGILLFKRKRVAH